ncbi:hypothetical protein THAR02_11439 [Trichoderma harzianum]|uniref:MULE transposase domain-containing protein n=1 Tax=Trichoderma harzianum TaxID=5544 RepID=A0A0F9WTE6_TRIHA|nr:hypothetical protein THAR02_11439 [Trichoderma harzianum]
MEGGISYVDDFLNDVTDSFPWSEGPADNSQGVSDDFNLPDAVGDDPDLPDAVSDKLLHETTVDDEIVTIASQNEGSGREIPLPPPSQEYDTFEELFNALQLFYRDHGAAIVKKSPGNKVKVNGEMIPTWYAIECDRGARRPPEGAGIRKTATEKVNSHKVHRRRTQAQKEIEKSLSEHKALPAREMGDIVRSQTEGPTYFNSKDIYNDRQTIRQSRLEGLTPTQQWINLLQRQGIRHFIRYDDEDNQKVKAVFWTYPWCETMWKRFPQVLGMDNTYKTNRFKMYLFQVTGVTDQKSVANFAFGLTDSEKEDGYDWLSSQIDTFRRQLEIPPPDVVITDKEIALKNALKRTFPDAQQQLCLYHVMANVRARITSKWKKGEDDEPEASDEAVCSGETAGSLAADPVSSLAADDFADALADDLPAEPRVPAGLDKAPFEYSKAGLEKAWKAVVYAEEEDDFENAWAALVILFEEKQRDIVSYLVREHLPWADQFLQCRIKRYRNFGQRTNSPTETAHKDIKSYLVTGTGDLLHLHEALVQMLAKKERDYLQTAAKQEMKLRKRYIGQKWLGSLPTKITYAAVDLLAQQHRIADASVRGDKNLPPKSRCFFTQQYAMPCAHYLAEEVILAGKPLTIKTIHPRWWLDKPLDLNEPLLRIQDPDIVQNLRGRPRLPQNDKRPVDAGLQPISTTSSQLSLPTSSQGSRRLNSSIRRTRTAAEIEEGSQRASPPSAKRSRSAGNARGRGTRGRQRGGRGRGQSNSYSSSLATVEESSSAVEEVIPATQPDQ